MTETDDIKARLERAIPHAPTYVTATILDAITHITRLEERCAALEGQVEAGAAEIEQLKIDAGKLRVCLNCGRTADAVAVKRGDDRPECRGPDGLSGCTFDATPQEAWEFWRQKAHDYMIRAEAAERARAQGEPVAVADESFQARVDPWMQACFGPAISADRLERGDRLIEEVLELLQSGGYPAERVSALTGYVWSRPAGDPPQEVGGVMVTLAAYCLAHGLDMHEAGETELARIWTKVEKIRAKQAAKPTGSALPQAWLVAAPEPAKAASNPNYWGWWAGQNEEICTIGPRGSRDEVIAAARDERLGEWQDDDGRWKLSFHICEAEQRPLRLSDWIDVERMLERAEEDLSDSDRVGCDGDDGPWFETTKEQEGDLEKRIAAACDEWQATHRLLFRCITFSASRNHEHVVCSLPLDDAAGEDA